MKIEASELVLNADGSVYHLNILPDDIADIVIFVGDPGRVERVSQHFDRIEVKKSKREFVTHTGYIGDKRLTVISTGIGPDNIDIVMNELDALANIDLEKREIKKKHKSLKIIRIGTSGSLQKDIDVDTIIVSSYGMGFDNLMRFYEYDNSADENILEFEFSNHIQKESIQLPVTPYIVAGCKKMLQSIGKGYKSGITATCPGFYGPQGRQLRLQAKSTDFLPLLGSFSFNNHRITNFEMETSAIYGLAGLLGHQALSCNVILANRISGEFVKDHIASEAYIIKEILSRIVSEL